ncbi:MAG: LD-carboxypeptidase [Pseudomonadota bacterium]
MSRERKSRPTTRRRVVRPWQVLAHGDVIDVVAPASKCPPERLAAGLAVLREWGYVPRVPPDLFADTPLVANTEAVRWQHLRRALTAPDSAAVWCVRGGYGCLHMLGHIARMRMPGRSKPVLGFSDVTALQLALWHLWGWPGLHAPVVAQLGDGSVSERDLKSLRGLLDGSVGELSLGRLRRVAGRADAAPSETIAGPLYGGNLTTLMTLLGGAVKPAAGGCIVFFEDVNERGYSVDRMLRMLENAGTFRRARAVVLGEFLRAEEPGGETMIPAAFSNLAERLRCPVFAGLPIGHGRRLPPLVIGAPATLTDRGNGWSLDYRVGTSAR